MVISGSCTTFHRGRGTSALLCALPSSWSPVGLSFTDAQGDRPGLPVRVGVLVAVSYALESPLAHGPSGASGRKAVLETHSALWCLRSWRVPTWSALCSFFMCLQGSSNKSPPDTSCPLVLRNPSTLVVQWGRMLRTEGLTGLPQD